MRVNLISHVKTLDLARDCVLILHIVLKLICGEHYDGQMSITHNFRMMAVSILVGKMKVTPKELIRSMRMWKNHQTAARKMII